MSNPEQPVQLVGAILDHEDFRRHELAVWVRAPGGLSVPQMRAMCEAASKLAAPRPKSPEEAPR